MDSKITINIVEPGSGPVVPNTGLFTSGIGGPEATIITAVSAVLILTIAAIVVAFLYRKQKKSGKVTKLVHLVDSTKTVLKSKKRITAGLSAIALLASAGTLTTLLANAGKSNTNAVEEDGLTLDVTGGDITIEVGDEPVFAVAEVKATVKEATLAGYTLTAYTDNTDLVSTTNPDSIIPMVTLPENSVETLESSEVAGELTALTDNTYGLALDEKPITKDEAVYTSLSIDPEEPTILKATDFVETEANDTTTIYYGFYITPDVPYGTYKGSTISYEAIPNLATISYNAAGLYYNNDESITTNTVGYKPSTPDSPIEELTGEYLTPAPLNPDSSSSPIHYTFLGWSKTEGATTPDYEDEEDIIANLTLSPNEDLTLYAVWHYDTVLSFNGNTSDGGEPIADITIPAGTTITLPPNTYTKDGYSFNGWNTSAAGTGESYPDQGTYIAPVSESQNVTLYAQWKQIFYMQDVATWGSALSQGDTVEAVDSRDGKSYWVAKLADDNIWMTQNLDLELSTEKTLTPADTNITADWTPADSTISFTSTSVPGWQQSTTVPYSADPGPLYVYSSGTTSNDEQYTSLEACKEAHSDCSAKNHVGNYYNWSAAVADNNTAGITEPYTNVETSICPAGWRLPANATNADDPIANNEQDAWISTYEDIVQDPSSCGGTCKYRYYQEGGFNKIRTNPLWLARSGHVVGSGSLYNTGRTGSYWSSTVSNSSLAYYLGFGSGDVSPAGSSGRYYGYSVRCVAR